MRMRRWLIGAPLVALACLAGCGEGDQSPNATPNTPSPGHGPSDGGSGNTPGEAGTTAAPGNSAP